MSYVNKWNYQVSTRLMDSIVKEPISFEGAEDEHAVAVFVKLKKDLDVCMALGHYEHTNDWDPYIEVTLKSGIKFKSAPGYFQFDISEAEYRGYPELAEDLEVWLPTCSTESETGEDKYIFSLGAVKEIRVLT